MLTQHRTAVHVCLCVDSEDVCVDLWLCAVFACHFGKHMVCLMAFWMAAECTLGALITQRDVRSCISHSIKHRLVVSDWMLSIDMWPMQLTVASGQRVYPLLWCCKPCSPCLLVAAVCSTLSHCLGANEPSRIWLTGAVLLGWGSIKARSMVAEGWCTASHVGVDAHTGLDCSSTFAHAGHVAHTNCPCVVLSKATGCQPAAHSPFITGPDSVLWVWG